MGDNRSLERIVKKACEGLHERRALLQHILGEIVSYEEILNAGLAFGVKGSSALTVYKLKLEKMIDIPDADVMSIEELKIDLDEIRMTEEVIIETGEVQVSKLELRKEKDEKTDVDVSKEQIEKTFKNSVLKGDAKKYVIKLRRIYRDDNSKQEIYYLAYFLKQNFFSTAYLQNIEAEYFKWISWLLRKLLGLAPKADFRVTDKMKNEIMYCFQNSFHEMVNKLFRIDLEFIIALAGDYYEGDECSAILEYCLVCPDITKDMAIALENPVEIGKSNIRRIRKLIQVVQKDQCLVAVLGNECWEIVGICDERKIPEKYISFRFLRHMVWTMECLGKTAVCYDCGEYRIDSKELKIREFCDKYEQVFRVKANGNLVCIVERAIAQAHGTTVLLIDKTQTKAMADLFENGIGIKIHKVDCQSGKNIISGITSIDGAVLLDQDGNNYGMGIILFNSAQKYKGKQERGARYNAAQNYIELCAKKHWAAMAIVVSADKTVDVLTSKDF